MSTSFTIIGGGLIGLSTALEVKLLAPGSEVRLLEKEATVGRHQSTHNSGVLHAGLYYKPGSLKARLAVKGIRRMIEFCQQHGVAHEICGKLVVATTPDEITRLHTLQERGEKNGLRGLRWLEQGELREIEPHAAGLAAVHVPEEGIVNYQGVCTALESELSARGVMITTNAALRQAERRGSEWHLQTAAGDFSTGYIINCAGLHSDWVAASAGEEREARILPFRGEYYKLRASAQHLVRNLIYPVPDPSFPFLGVHFTRLIEGGVEAGPNAVLAMAREGYSKWRLNPRDLFDALSYGGLWKFMRQHRSMAWDEVVRSFSKAKFCASLQRLVPAVQITDLEPGITGVRAQAMLPDGTLMQDFHFVERAGALHVINAPSPGATACLAIGEFVARRALASIGLITPQTDGPLESSGMGRGKEDREIYSP